MTSPADGWPPRPSWWPAEPTGRRSSRRTGAGRTDPFDGMDSVHLVYRDIHGAQRVMRALVGEDGPPTDPVYLARRVVDTQTGAEYVQKRLPAESSRRGRPPTSTSSDTDSYDLLDNEIQIGLHLVQSFSADSYPRELSRLVGSYLGDTEEEPFILLTERGYPAEKVANRLLLDQVDAFPASLLRALECLAAAGVVHRCLTPQTVRWDDRHVQVTDFRHAALAEEPTGPAPEFRWAAPEARDGLEPARPPEDLYSAGLILVHVLTGRLPGTSGAPDPRGVGGDVAGVLADFFDAADLRSTPRDVLARMGVPPSTSAGGAEMPPQLADPKFLEGRVRFDRIRRQRRSDSDSDLDMTRIFPRVADNPPWEG